LGERDALLDVLGACAKLAQTVAVECLEQPADGRCGRVERAGWDEHVVHVERCGRSSCGLVADEAHRGSTLGSALDEWLGWAQLTGHRAAMIYRGERLVAHAVG